MIDQKTKEIINFGYFVVGVVDILGQKAKLDHLAEVTSYEPNLETLIPVLKETFGVVSGTCKLLVTCYNSFDGAEHIPDDATEEQRKYVQSVVKSDLKLTTISDSIITHAPLDGEPKSKGINNLYATLFAFSATMLFSLAAKHPVRGAIDIGYGAEMYDDVIYGSCLNSVNYLESKCAQYPRIVVGNNVEKYLQSFVPLPEDSIVNKYKKYMAEQCNKLIRHDIDGITYLHYLGDDFIDLQGGKNELNEVIRMAWQYVITELERHSLKGDDKLEARYRALTNYFIEYFLKNDIPVQG